MATTANPYTLARLAVTRAGHTLSDGSRLLVGTLVEVIDVQRRRTDGTMVRIAPKRATEDDRFQVRVASGATAWVYGADLNGPSARKG